ncbi:MAG: hypothetical protein QM760_02010, partial [Nibricoccus sp.]
MRRRSSWIVLLLIAVVFTGGLCWLFKLRLGQGDLFPAYSTLRADPLGTRAIYEALQELPGMRVERSLQAMKKIPVTPARTIVFAGMWRGQWESFSVQEANALDGAVRAGSRAVIVFRAERMSVDKEMTEALSKKKAEEKAKAEKKEKEKAEKKDEDSSKKSSRERDSGSPRNDEGKGADLNLQMVDWTRRWGMDLRLRWITDGDKGAQKKQDAPAE